LKRVPQPSEGVTYAQQLTKEEGRIDWTKGAKRVRDHARAMHPWPGAYTALDGETLKLFKPEEAHGKGEPGVVLGSADGLVVGTGDGAVAFMDAQLPNKRRMSVAELTRGRTIPAGTRLG
jgi:methionyl-tRNA formyltransferase